MRRFSQRNSLVTLSEINVTPLLDLAFVLLIIFVITTPMLESSLSLKLPQVDLLAAVPSMFGYNWLVHKLRVLTVELDNFAQALASKLETEFLKDE